MILTLPQEFEWQKVTFLQRRFCREMSSCQELAACSDVAWRCWAGRHALCSGKCSSSSFQFISCSDGMELNTYQRYILLQVLLHMISSLEKEMVLGHLKANSADRYQQQSKPLASAFCRCENVVPSRAGKYIVACTDPQHISVI